MLLRDATLADGHRSDVRLAGAQIAEVDPRLAPREGEEILDLTGFLLLPAPAEPHAHLDKALTADQVPNRTGDLVGAIEAWTAHRAHLSFDDIVDRARRAALLLLGNGATAIRTHVDVASNIGLLGIEALVAVRAALDGLVDLQIVALVATPTSGAAGADHRALLRAAMETGADVVGGCPHLDPDPLACMHACLELAGELGRPLDLHTDETLDPDALNVRDLAAVVMATGFGHGATASHCVSLGVQDVGTQRAVAEAVAAAGVAVVTLPQTNLFLQGRDRPVATPRGLTALRPLLDAGATLAAGGDNLQDPFNLVGRGDPLEAASLLVAAGHLLPDEAYTAVAGASRRAMGLAAGTIVAGAPAELLAVRAGSVREAIAFGPPDRVVIHRGRVVARFGP